MCICYKRPEPGNQYGNYRMFKKTVLIVSLVFIIMISIVPGGVFYVMQDLRYYSEQALKPLEDTTGFRINFDDISWRLSTGLGVKVKNLK